MLFCHNVITDFFWNNIQNIERSFSGFSPPIEFSNTRQWLEIHVTKYPWTEILPARFELIPAKKLFGLKKSNNSTIGWRSINYDSDNSKSAVVNNNGRAHHHIMSWVPSDRRIWMAILNHLLKLAEVASLWQIFFGASYAPSADILVWFLGYLRLHATYGYSHSKDSWEMSKLHCRIVIHVIDSFCTKYSSSQLWWHYCLNCGICQLIMKWDNCFGFEYVSSVWHNMFLASLSCIRLVLTDFLSIDTFELYALLDDKLISFCNTWSL